MVDFDALALKVGEDVLITHQKVASHQHEFKVHGGVVGVVLCHHLQNPVHGQPLQDPSFPQFFMETLLTDMIRPRMLSSVAL